MFKKPWILCNQLLKAIEEGNYSNAEQVLDSGLDVDSMLIDGKSAISICAERGCTEMAQLLIARGCSLSLKTQKGESPLHLAVLQSHYDMVKFLLKNRADVTSIDVFGRTALHIACRMNLLGITRLLLEKTLTANINKADRGGATPLMYACQCGSIDMIRDLLAQGSKVNLTDVEGDSPLLGAIYNSQSTTEMFTLLLDAGADVKVVNNRNETALLRALLESCLRFPVERKIRLREISELLIDYGSDVNAKNTFGQSALHLAACSNNDYLVWKLLDAGGDMNSTDNLGYSPLFYACRSGMRKVADLLINSGANLDTHTWCNVLQRDCFTLLNYVLEKAKECPTLRGSCRIVIRKSLNKSIEKSALQLPLPASVIKYIQLIN